MENYSMWFQYQHEVAVHLLRWPPQFTARVWAALSSDLAPFLSGRDPKAPDPITAALLLRKQAPTVLADLASRCNISEKQVWALLIDRAEPTTTPLDRLSAARDQIRQLTAQEDFAEQQRLHRNFNYGSEERQRQSGRAQKPRVKVDEGSGQLSPAEIITKLAGAKQYKDWSAKELWPAFLGEMGVNHFDPVEGNSKRGDLNCTYDLKGKNRTISLGYFACLVSGHRKEK
ncbi:hypothetical protein [Massilia sp. SYSU DXS3249]